MNIKNCTSPLKTDNMYVPSVTIGDNTIQEETENSYSRIDDTKVISNF